MTRGLPSMTALLGILAVAGYQNREEIGALLKGFGGSGTAGPGGQGGLLGKLGGTLGNAGPGAVLSGGLAELLERFKQSGQGDTAESWIGTGPNKPVTPPQLEQAVGSDVLETLSEQTGMSREELLARLSRELPDAVDKYTPEGRLPTDAEVSRT